MVKIGRNELCHCGSGKKYKKCCIEKDKQMVMDQQTDNEPIGRLLTYEEVNEQSTEEIIYRLKQVGIPFNKEVFLNDVEEFYSAEALSENWFDQYNVIAKGRMEDYPWLAAWILWDRLAPDENLSMEQIDSLIERGFKYLNENKSISACDTWLKAWDAIKYRFNPSFKTLDFLDQHYSGSFFISNFCQDLELELHNAGLEDATYYEKRITYCKEFCKAFPEESELIIHNMRRAVADSYGLLEQYKKAESEFDKLVKDFPHNPWGYIGWGDLLFLEQQTDYHRAKELYEKGLTIAKDPIDIETVGERLADLKKAL